ncbi:COQ3-like protein [Mya arenaria]|uniref:COQ3-like protein n=1 Tax=Mya arenaria TaxID=6604 RepID=A0ABY7E9S6_MYAAR|nr:COQ3-like protein [Mya arenaria]
MALQGLSRIEFPPMNGVFFARLHRTSGWCQHLESRPKRHYGTNRPVVTHTMDEEELKLFRSLANSWWNETGDFEALHAMNKLRVPFIRDGLVQTREEPSPSISQPLQGLSIVDVGSGGGLLSEPGGSLFVTTMNKTLLSKGLAIYGAERVFRVVPEGTHDWEKFVPPEDLRALLEKNGMHTRLIHGMLYMPVLREWRWVQDTNINYALHAVKD